MGQTDKPSFVSEEGTTRRRFLLATGAAMASGSILSACGNGADAGAGSSGGSGSKTIGFAMATFVVPRYKNVDLPNFQKTVRGAGYQARSNQANDDAEQQASNVENLLALNLGALALQPVIGEASVSMVRKATRAGVPVVAYNTGIPSADVKAFVSRNNIEVGRDKAKAAGDFTPLTGNWVIVAGEPGNAVADELTKGYLEVLQPLADAGKLKIVSEEHHKGFDPDLARKQAEQALTKTNNNIKGFMVNNDGMAAGVLAALRAQGLAGKVFVCGLDASQEACRAIVQGTMAFSSFTPFDEMGSKAGELCVKLARGEKVASSVQYDMGAGKVPHFPIPSYNVTKDNLIEYLRKYSPSYVNADEVFRGIPKSKWPTGTAELLAS
jgi:D-xylose transport system substrate-binding protein